MKSALRGRLRGHFAACAAGAVVVMGGASTASAQIAWSGIIDQNIPSTSNGLYLNVVNYFLSGGSSGWNTTGGTGTTVPGWDVNPFSSSGLSFFSPPSSGSLFVGGVYMRTSTALFGASNLAFNTAIGDGALWSSGGAQTTGSNPFNLNSSENLVGFRFFNEAGGTIHYGWMRIELAGALNAQPRALVEFAFELTPGASIGAGVIPAPGAIALLGLAGLAGSRRRRG
jgi:MYXO-CTERM domain-containing protein